MIDVPYLREGLMAKRLTRLLSLVATLGMAFSIGAISVAQEKAKFTVELTKTSLHLKVGKQPVATYVFVDEKIDRPFYAHVRSLTGAQVTRNYPPKMDEPNDHADMHPGIWLAFADISGHDFWRNQGSVRHDHFVAEPKVERDVLSFTVRNEYLAPKAGGGKKVATEICRHSWEMCEGGLLLSLDSELSSASKTEPLVFGDQEEMGLGIRVATGLRVKDAGGTILTSEGKHNEKEAWGTTARWCDYSSVEDGRRIGITLMPHPGNFRESWFHVRDYGLMVANPFGRKAFTGKEPSRLEIKPGEKMRLRYGVWIYAVKEKIDEPREAAYRAYMKRAGQ